MPRKLFDIDMEEITLCGSAGESKEIFYQKAHKRLNIKSFMEV